MGDFNFEAFADGYIVAALWADCLPPEGLSEASETGGREHLEVPGAVREAMIERGMLRDFVERHEADLLAYCGAVGPWVGTDSRGYGEDPAEARAGHDFWLTRAGHGAGFWDRGLGDLGDRLTEAAKSYGSPDDHLPYDRGDGTVGV